MYTRWASPPPSAWRSWAAMMLAGSLLAAIAEARAWRSRWGWAATPALAARRVKARLAWLGLTGVPRSVRKTRSSSTGRGGWPGSTQCSQRVGAWPRARRSRCCWRRCWRSAWTAKGGRVRTALLAADLSGPTATSPRATVATGVSREDGGVDDGEGLAELGGAGVQVQVGPFQAAQLAVAGPGRRRQDRPNSKPWA